MKCNYQRKFRHPTSDYTESRNRRSVNQEMRSRRCDTAEMCEMCEMRGFWWVGIALLRFSIVLWLRKLGKSASKNRRAQRVGCPRCRNCTTLCQGTIRKSKSLSQKSGSVGTLFEAEFRKFAPGRGAAAILKSKSLKTGSDDFLSRESESGVKIVQNCDFRRTHMKLTSTKFAPGCGPRAVRKSKIVKTAGARIIF